MIPTQVQFKFFKNLKALAGRVALTAAGIFALSSTASAQAPFSCSNNAYVMFGPTAAPGVTIYNFDLATGTVGDTIYKTGSLSNCLAYNPLDSLLYIMVTDTPLSAASRGQLVQVDADGIATTLTIPNLSLATGLNPTMGAFTPDGYYVINATSAPSNRYVTIDLDPSRATYQQIVDPTMSYALAGSPYYKTATANFSMADWAYNPTDGLLYGLTNAGRVATLDIETGAYTIDTDTIKFYDGTTPGTATYGAAFIDATGKLYVTNSTGVSYGIDITTNKVVSISIGLAGTNYDGASCPFTTLSYIISGNLFNDSNGLTDSIVNGTGTNGGGAIYATLYDNTTGKVVASVLVGTNGAYAFGATPDNDYSIYIGNEQATVGQDEIPSSTLPAEYENTGEQNCGITPDCDGSDGTPNGIIELGVVSAEISQANFGIRLLPVAVDDSLGGQIAGTAATVPNILTNDSDPNGGTLVADSITLVIPLGMPVGTVATATDAQGDITEITVPGEGVWVLNADGSVTFTPEATFFGDPTPIQYSVTNEAGSASNIADISIDYNDVSSISGVVYNDGNGTTGGVNGTPLEGVTVTLYESDGTTVIATTVTAADGSYSFDSIAPGNYVVGVTPLAVYNHSSATDVTPADGFTSVVFAGTADVQNIDFGIQQPPVADAKDYSVANSAFSTTPPAGFTDISVSGDEWQSIPMSSSALTGITGGALSGSDPEDCAAASTCSNGATFVIETINSNTRLFYDFGGATGVQEIDVTLGAVEIENFDATKMLIWAQDGAGEAGDEIGFTYSITDQAGASSAPVTYIIETATPLPVQLLSFVAKLQNSDVLLSWITASEVNNKGFDVERSEQGSQWSKIGFVAAATADGNSTANQSYSFTDMQPLAGLNAYRLKQIDIDGACRYSPVQLVLFDNNSVITVMPNPTKADFTVYGLRGVNTIIVSNTIGAVLLNTGAIDAKEQHISLQAFAAGTYFVKVVQEDGTQQSFRVVKQ